MTSRLILLRMRNVLGKSCKEYNDTHCMFNNFFTPENRAVYEIMLKHMVQTDREATDVLTRWR